MDWNALGCARGHVTYAPDEPELREGLRADTPVGEAWRCLRCAAYVPGPPTRSGPASDAPILRRGRELRDVIVFRFLAVERALRGLVVLSAAYGVFRFRADKQALRNGFEENLPLLRPLAEHLGWNLNQSAVVDQLRDILAISETTLLLVAVALLVYAGIEFVEAVGLWRIKRWGEYFAVIATAAFIPFEIYEILEKVTWLRVGALAFNVAVVLYIVLTKRLFRVRGGSEAYDAERRSTSVMEITEVAHRQARADRRARTA